jgi:hypothetical protein
MLYSGVGHTTDLPMPLLCVNSSYLCVCSACPLLSTNMGTYIGILVEYALYFKQLEHILLGTDIGWPASRPMWIEYPPSYVHYKKTTWTRNLRIPRWRKQLLLIIAEWLKTYFLILPWPNEWPTALGCLFQISAFTKYVVATANEHVYNVLYPS